MRGGVDVQATCCEDGDVEDGCPGDDAAPIDNMAGVLTTSGCEACTSEKVDVGEDAVVRRVVRGQEDTEFVRANTVLPKPKHVMAMTVTIPRKSEITPK